jgi:hypothetical protein
MKRCGHSKWLALRIQRNELVLLESDRLQTLVDHIPNPDAHQLSLVVLVGGVAKSSALQWLTSGRKCRKPTGRRGSGSDIHLHLGGSSAFGDKVILLADGDLPYHVPKYQSSSVGECHETTRRILPRIREGVGDLALDEAADNLYSRLFCPFADVFCFFSADFGGFRPIVRYLASWLEKGRPSTLSKATYPRVLVVAETTKPCDESEKEAKDVFLGEFKKETTKEFAERFSALDVVTVSSEGRMSAHARYQRFEERVVQASDQVRFNRAETRTLFSARHFAAFFRHACDHFARNPREPFDFVKASRLRNPVSVDLGKHLSNFLKNIKSLHELAEFAVPVISSSFLLDHYPPGMHGMRVSHLDMALEDLTIRQRSNLETCSRRYIKMSVIR